MSLAVALMLATTPGPAPVPNVPTAINFTGSSIAFNVPSGTAVGNLSTVGGQTPYVYTCSNSKFQIVGSQVQRSSTGTLTPGVSESLNFTSTDLNGASTDTSTNGQGPYTVLISIPSTFSVPLTLTNIGASSAATPHVSFGHPFADGDIPAGGSVTATDSLGSPVTVQMDGVSTWPSGCVKWANLSWQCSETFAAGISKIYTLGASNTPPDNTPDSVAWGGATPADWAATLGMNCDIKSVHGPGLDAASNVYTTSLNTILAATGIRNPGFGTTYPTSGWELMKQGKVCIEFHGWQYIKNDSTGFYHGYVRADFWVKAWSPTGPFEIDFRTCQPNVWNTITATGGTTDEMYNLPQQRWLCPVQIKDGSTVLKYDGGTSDSNAVTVPNVNFNTTTNRLNYPVGTFFPQTAVIFSSGGSLPSGLAANTPYWPGYPNGADQPFLVTQQWFCSLVDQNGQPPQWAPNTAYGKGTWVFNSNVYYFCITAGTSAASGGPTGGGVNSDITDGSVHWTNVTVPFVTQGSGTITAAPTSTCFGSTAWATADLKGQPCWSGSGTFPQIAAGHDFHYLTQKTKWTLAYNAAAGSTTTNLTIGNYLPNKQTGGIYWNQSQTGPSLQRIGFNNADGAATLFNPSDPYYYWSCIQGALAWHMQVYHHMYDESGGMPLIGNNGHNNSGSPYSGLPANIPGWIQFNVPGSVSSVIVPRGAQWSPWNYTFQNSNGLGGQYYADNSHVPDAMQIAYLKTTRPIFLELAVGQVNNYSTQIYQGFQTINGRVYYNLTNGAFGSCQLRGWAWAWRCLIQLKYMIPDNHLFQPVITDYYEQNMLYEADRINNVYPPNQVAAGIPNCLDHDNAGAHYAPWMLAFYIQVVALEAWRGGQTTAAAAAVATNAQFLKSFWNNYLASVNPLAVNFYPAYDFKYAALSQDWVNCYTNPTVMFNAAAAAGLIPSPWINYLYDHDQGYFHVGFPGNTDSYHVFGQCAVWMHNLAVPGDANLLAAANNISNALSLASGLPTSQGGIQWTGTDSNGTIDNVQTHAVFQT